MTERPHEVPTTTNADLVRYAGTLAAATALVHGGTALLVGSRMTVLTPLLLLVPAVYVLAFVRRRGAALRGRAYGMYLVHAVAYVLVTGSFWLHAAVLDLTGREQVLRQGWSAVLLALTVGWGVGLLVHSMGARRHHGYELAEV